MRETQRNIKMYQKRLVGLKSKLTATAVLFVMSIAMLTTATFAYVVLSTAPEVSNISTTVAGNGNLEVALASSDEYGNLKKPEKSKAGDSNLPLVERNITWGNLVNLNDDSYGLQDIVLRPAELNLDELKTKPLIAVMYGEDGRITDYESNYAYTNYDLEAKRFLITDKVNYGVRAISNYTTEDLSTDDIEVKFEETKRLLRNAQKHYAELVDSDSPYMKAIASLVGEYASAKLGDDAGNDTINVSSYVDEVYFLLGELSNVYDEVMDIYWSLANAQLFKADKPLIPSLDVLLTLSQKDLESSTGQYGILMNGFDTAKSDRDKLKQFVAELEDEYTRSKTENVYFSEIEGAVNFAVSIDKAKLAVSTNPSDKYGIGNVGSLMDKYGIMSLLSSKFIGTIEDGLIVRLERLIGEKMYAEGMKITVKYIISKDVETTIYTIANESEFIIPPLINQSYNAETKIPETAVAGEVYGMVIDFWVRTNANNSYLILEGEKVEEQQPLMHNNYYVYEYTYIVEIEKADGTVEQSTNTKRFFHDPQGTRSEMPESANLSEGKFYYLDSGDEITFSDEAFPRDEFIKNLSPVYQTVVVGYDGVNRVWEEGVNNPERSTTQGLGSCYIIYPESPVVQQQALELMKSMKIAFLDEESNLLAEADFNPDIAIEEEGKVIVPIELKETSKTVTNEFGEITHVISQLKCSEEQLITAIVYLDGKKLSNVDVSAENSINGTLNLQFGSTTSLESMNDEDLKHDEINLSASISADVKDYDSTTPIYLNVNVGDADPNTVSAIFMRKINLTQGVRQETINLEKVENSEGEWTAEVPFNNPGTYVLRSVWVDGVEYNLPEDDIIELLIKGFSIDNIVLQTNGKTVDGYMHIMTIENSVSSNIEVEINSDKYNIGDVKASFVNAEGQIVNSTLYKNPSGNTWSGNITFTSSGTYTLEYIIVDGDYWQTPEEGRKILSLLLGIQTKVDVSPSAIKYDPTIDNYTIKLAARITDNRGNALTNLSNVELMYLKNGTNINPLIAELKWDANLEAYSGQFNINSAGTYSFSSLTIGSGDTLNYITQANAQNISIINPEPPVYESSLFVSDEYQFAPNGVASINLPFSNADGAIIKAEFTNSNGKTYVSDEATIVDNSNGIQIFRVNIPTSEVVYNAETGEYSTNQISDITGQWKLTNVLLSNVYVDNILYLPDASNENERWLSWDMSSRKIQTYVVQKLKVSIANNHDIAMTEDYFESYLAKDKYKLDDISISITDSKNNVQAILALVENNELSIQPKLQYVLSKDTNHWWKEYQDLNVTNTEVSPITSFTDNGNMEFTNENDIVFVYPGTYKPQLKLTINSGTVHEYTMSDNGTSITSSTNSPIIISLNEKSNYPTNKIISWIRPTITITGTEPALGSSFTGWKNGAQVSTANSMTENDSQIILNVYNKAEYSSSTSCGTTTHKVAFTAPRVDITLNYKSNHSGAKVVVDNTKTSEYTTDPTFTFAAGSLSANAYMGQESGSASDTNATSVTYSNKMIASGSKATSVIFTVNGKDYTFNLPKEVVINYEY